MPAQAERAGDPCCRPHTTSCSCSTAKAKDPSSPRLCRPALTPRAFTQKRSRVGAASAAQRWQNRTPPAFATYGGRFVEAGFAATRRGTPVCVVRGPLKGLKGKLVRYRKRSYVVLIAASIGILVHVPKWYCHPLKADTGIPHQQEKKPETSHAEQKHPRKQPGAPQ